VIRASPAKVGLAFLLGVERELGAGGVETRLNLAMMVCLKYRLFLSYRINHLLCLNTVAKLSPLYLMDKSRQN